MPNQSLHVYLFQSPKTRIVALIGFTILLSLRQSTTRVQWMRKIVDTITLKYWIEYHFCFTPLIRRVRARDFQVTPSTKSKKPSGVLGIMLTVVYFCPRNEGEGRELIYKSSGPPFIITLKLHITRCSLGCRLTDEPPSVSPEPISNKHSKAWVFPFPQHKING